MTTNELNAVVTQRIELSPGLLMLRVAPVGWELPPFKPGQFAVLGLPPEVSRHPFADPADDPEPRAGALIRRSYSIASSSAERQYLEFYLTLVRSGSLSPRLFALGVGDRIWLGPKLTGVFTFDRSPADANLVMIATGTGLAPYMSLLRSDLRSGHPRRIAVLHGARHSWDLGYRAELITMQRLCPSLTYLATISRPDEEPVPWGGETGYVQDLWATRRLDDAWGLRPSPSDTHVFLCGNPEMVDGMTAILAEEGFREHSRVAPGQIHAERFW
jgi:ferredoxin--NADP+ reductase